MEHDDTREPVAKEVRLLVPIAKSEAALKRISYGVVLEPDTEDLQGDVMTAEDIEAAAYDWMERSQRGGHMHADTVAGAKVVESYIAPCDIPVETAGGPETIRKGSWVLAMRWPQEIWESIAKGDLTGYSVGGTGVRLALEEIGKKGKWVPGPNAGWRMANGDPARDGAAAEGGGTPADRGAAAAREDDRRRSRAKPKGGAHKVGDQVRLKEDGGVGEIVDYEPGKDGSPDEYAIAPEDLGEGGPKAIWVRADEIETFNEDSGGEPKMGDKVTFRDGVEAKVVGVSRDHILVEGPGVPNGTMAVGYDDLDREGNIKLDAEYKPKYRGEYERPSAYGGGLEEQVDDERDGYPSGTVDDEQRYPTGGKWPGEDDYASDAEREDAEWEKGYGQDASQGWEAEAGYKTFTRGQKVRTPTGRIRTVHSQRGAQVFVEEESNGWYHPSKLYPVKKSLTEIVREALEEVAKKGKWAPGPNAGWRLASGPADRGANEGRLTDQETREEYGDESPDLGVGSLVRIKDSPYKGKVLSVEYGTLGWPDEYDIMLDPEDVGWEDEPIWRRVTADQLETITDPDERYWLEDRFANAGVHADPGQKKDKPPRRKTGTMTAWWAETYANSKVHKSLPEVVREALEDVAKDKGWAPGPNAGWRRRSGEDLTGYHSDKSTPRLAAWHRSQTAATPEERRRAAAEYERLADEEDAAQVVDGGRKHITRDGVVIEDQPKIQRIRGAEMYASPDGSVQLDYSYWKWTGGGGSRGVAKNPPLHTRGTWAAWPRGADENDINQAIFAHNKTLAEFIASLEPGEYKLAT